VSQAHVRRSSTLPPVDPDRSGWGAVVALGALLALSVAFVATGGGIVDSLASFGGAGAGVLGAVGTPGGTSSPMVGASPSGSPSASASASVAAPPSASPTATPAPARAPTSLDLLAGREPRSVFVSEQTDVLCAAAAVQMTVELVTGEVDRSIATQRSIHELLVSLTSRADSLNGGTGPLGMAIGITRLSGVDYELRIAPTRTAAIHDAAATLERTHEPIVLLAWRGAHAWVMTGFRADADPVVFGGATIAGAFVLDPWYPRVSRIWGPSDPPNTFQDAKELVRNYLPWKRPEGGYPARDGKFLYLAPVESTTG
jgi:hypothetical protein